MVYTPLRSLPPNFILLRRLDIREKRILIKLNLWSLGLLIAAWIGFSRLTKLIHPLAQASVSFSINRIVDAIIFVVVLLVITATTLLLHELIHGFFFWLFTKEAPRYGFKNFYAFASAPKWYLLKKQYLVTALAPLVSLSILAVVGLVLTSPSWALVWLWVFVFNTSGSVGDLWVVWTILRSPAEVLIRDAGDMVEIFSKGPDRKKA